MNKTISFHKWIVGCSLTFMVTLWLNGYLWRAHQSSQGATHLQNYTLPNKQALCLLGGEFTSVLADLYWCLFAQQPQDTPPRYVYRLADLITELDPHFNVVYRCAALHLTLRAGRHDLADKLLLKGLKSPFNSADWRIYFYLGFHGSTHKRTARFLRLASQQQKMTICPTLQANWLAPPTYLDALSLRLAAR